MDNSQIKDFLQAVGKKTPPSSQLILVGGSALILLGSQRSTIDIDFLGDDLAPDELGRTILSVAKDMKIFAEAVPLERFIPLPEGFQERAIHIGQFGNLEVLVADPYSIALSKIERGFDTDFDDLLFLIRNQLVDVKILESVIRTSLTRAREFDMNKEELLGHFQELKRRSV